MPAHLEFTNVGAALAGPVPDLIIAAWQEVSAGHRASGRYTSDLSFTRLFPYRGNPLSVAVANTSPHAAILEEGHAGFHLPSRINWAASRSARLSKAGKHYLTIPFRHMTPGSEAGGISSVRARTAMPADVYRAALSAFREGGSTRGGVFATGRLSRPYGAMRDVPRWLTRHALATEGTPGYAWRAGKFEGMRREVQRNASGKATGSTFRTWRTLVEGSAGWWIPPMQGFHFTRQVVDRIKGPVADIIGAAAARDVAEVVSLKIAGGT